MHLVTQLTCVPGRVCGHSRIQKKVALSDVRCCFRDQVVATHEHTGFPGVVGQGQESNHTRVIFATFYFTVVIVIRTVCTRKPTDTVEANGKW